MAYPVTFDISRPATNQKPAVFIRILGYLILGVVNWLVIVLLPIYAAVQISSKKEKYLESDTVKGWLRQYIGLYAYAMILTDEFDGSKDPSFKFEVRPAGTPTVGGALLRWIFGIPHLLIVSALVSVGGIIWLIGSIMILIQGTYPEGLYDINRGIVRWVARYAAYHASLVQEYPPFAFDMGAEAQAANPA